MTRPEHKPLDVAALADAALTLAGAFHRLDNYGGIAIGFSKEKAEAYDLARDAARRIRALTSESRPVCNGNGG